ncbi:MAG: virulence factor MviN [Actinomycetaceae bacterium]|nr:virulence factor MviN [Actinomycetaceae bacterium]
MRKATGSVVGAAGVIAVLTLLSRVMGLVRKLAQSWAMSDGSVATAYDTANTVPNVLFEIAAGGALAGAVIPLVSRFLARKMGKEASQTASALATWILSISLPIVVAVIIFAEPIVAALSGPEADPATISLAATLLMIFAIQVPLYGLSVVATGVLQAHKRFVLPALSPLLSSLVVIGAFVAYALMVGPHIGPEELTRSGTYLLGWGTTLGVVMFSIPQFIAAARIVRLRPTLKFPEDAGRQTIRLASAGLAALLAQQIAILAIMFTANSLGDVGTYAAFNYAFAIFMVPYAVLAVPIATAVFPQISQAHELDDFARRDQYIAQSTRLVLAMGMIATVLLIALAKPAQIVLQLGNPIEGLDTGMRAMAPALVGYSLLYHGARVLYALDAGRRVVVTNTLSWATVIAVLFAAHNTGVSGRIDTLVAIGVALSVGMTVGVVSVIFAIRAQVGSQAVAGYMRTIVGLLPGLAIFGALGLWSTNLVLSALNGTIFAAFVSAFVGAVVVLSGSLINLYLIDRQALSALTRR